MGDDKLQSVDELKLQANEAFKSRKYGLAIELYSRAIEDLHGSDPPTPRGPAPSDPLSPDPSPQDKILAVLYSNRANTRLKLEEYGFAISDATAALALDPKYVKAMYRRGSGNFALGKYKDALNDFRRVTRIAPTDKDAQAKYKECARRVREQLFAEAIGESEADRVSFLETLDMDMYSAPDASYDGPRLDEAHADGGVVDRTAVTSDFVAALMDRFRREKKLHIRYAVQILAHARAHHKELPSVVDLPIEGKERITVCGDTHGQYYDLLRIFDMNGLPSKDNPYLFNGDFVDRGSFSVEVIMTLLAFKVHDPACIYLTRGNHESRNMNKIYGFEGEVRAKYTDRVFEMFMEVFRSLPLAHVLDGTSEPSGKRAFVLHGGLFSKDGVTLDELRNLNRDVEPDGGLVAEMLWSDPQPENGWGPSKRGIGVAFGPDVTHRFLEANNLDLVVRSHEMKENGYEVEANGKLITIFSAPNYCDQMGNKGAFIRFKADMVPEFVQFDAAPHPAVRPMAYAAGIGQFGI